MTIMYCDLCGRALDKGDSSNRVLISEFKADSCEQCARDLITFVKSGPYKSGANGTRTKL